MITAEMLIDVCIVHFLFVVRTLPLSLPPSLSLSLSLSFFLGGAHQVQRASVASGVESGCGTFGRPNGSASGSGRRRLSRLGGRAATRVVEGGGTSGRSGGLGRCLRAYRAGCSGRRRPCELASRCVVASFSTFWVGRARWGQRDVAGQPSLAVLRVPGVRLLGCCLQAARP